MEERRRHQRLVPESPLYVRVEGARRGPVLDLSEGGLAFGGAIPNSVFSMALDLPDGNGAIQAQGEIAWTSQAGDITGVRFVELAENYRRRLKNWISARAFPAAEQADLEFWPSPPLQVVSSDRSTKSESAVSKIFQVQQTPSARVTEIILSAIILSTAFVCIGYYLPNIGWRPKAADQTLPASAPAPKEEVAPVADVTPKPDSLPPRLPLDVAGYVVQVAAMTHEDNADALAVTLNRKNFPAFVFRRSGDRFYRVAVGPYRDQDSTMQVKEQIEKDGFTTILRNWSPQ